MPAREPGDQLMKLAMGGPAASCLSQTPLSPAIDPALAEETQDFGPPGLPPAHLTLKPGLFGDADTRTTSHLITRAGVAAGVGSDVGPQRRQRVVAVPGGGGGAGVHALAARHSASLVAAHGDQRMPPITEERRERGGEHIESSDDTSISSSSSRCREAGRQASARAVSGAGDVAAPPQAGEGGDLRPLRGPHNRRMEEEDVAPASNGAGQEVDAHRPFG